MSYKMNYCIETRITFLARLLGKTVIDIVEEEAKRNGIEIIGNTVIELNEDDPTETQFGEIIELKDGRKFKHELVDKNSNGEDEGWEVFEYKEIK